MGQGFPPCPVFLLPRNGFALMKSMNIAASSDLVSRLSSHRRVVALGDTDFTDVAAVVITAADSRSGILALLKRIGFHLNCFCIPNMLLNYLRALRR